MSKANEEWYKEQALKLARGRYQRDLVLGNRRWSGADLRGAARNWCGSYARSRSALLKRLTAAKVAYLLIHKRTGFIELKFGQPPDYYHKTQCAAGEAWLPGKPGLLMEIAEAVAEAELEAELAST